MPETLEVDNYFINRNASIRIRKNSKVHFNYFKINHIE